MNRIGINALCYSSYRAGIGNYIYQLLNELQKKPSGELTYIVFIPSSAKSDFNPSAGFSFVPLPAYNLLTRIFIEQLVIPILFFFFRLDKLHSTGNVAPVLLGKKNIVTVHDIYFIHNPSRFGIAKNIYLRFFVHQSVKRASHVITVSQVTKSDIVKFYGIPADKISVIYHGITKREEPISENSFNQKKFGINRSFFLFVGTLEPGKNILNLIKGSLTLLDKYQVVIAGKKGWGYEELYCFVRENKLEKSVLFLGYISDSELSYLYKNALALVLPSFHEGFGLPIIEAMIHECPVCCSNTSSLPEVAGDAALFFDPNKPEEIKECLIKVINDSMRQQLISRGKSNIKRFSWERCAEQTDFVYRKAL